VKALGIIAALLALSACDQKEVGRYQMTPIKIGKGDDAQPAVMVLDTTDGRVDVCAPDAGGIITCHVGTTAFP